MASSSPPWAVFMTYTGDNKIDMAQFVNAHGHMPGGGETGLSYLAFEDGVPVLVPVNPGERVVIEDGQIWREVPPSLVGGS